MNNNFREELEEMVREYNEFETEELNAEEMILEITKVMPEIIMGLLEEGIMEVSEIEYCNISGYDNDIIMVNSREYLVIMEDYVEERVKRYVEETLWAFNTNFLANYTGVDESVFEAISSNNRCEGNNEAIRSIIDLTVDGIDGFVEQAIVTDGAGHFLADYDGYEQSIRVMGEYYSVFRLY